VHARAACFSNFDDDVVWVVANAFVSRGWGVPDSTQNKSMAFPDAANEEAAL
jgi:hypothetical protein